MLDFKYSCSFLSFKTNKFKRKMISGAVLNIGVAVIKTIRQPSVYASISKRSGTIAFASAPSSTALASGFSSGAISSAVIVFGSWRKLWASSIMIKLSLKRPRSMFRRHSFIFSGSVIDIGIFLYSLSMPNLNAI